MNKDERARAAFPFGSYMTEAERHEVVAKRIGAVWGMLNEKLMVKKMLEKAKAFYNNHSQREKAEAINDVLLKLEKL